MNIITDLTNRIERYRATNKNPCKSYATESAADKAGKKLSIDAQNRFDTLAPGRYLVFYLEAWGRWVTALDLNEIVGRGEAKGGYLGFDGFYTF